MKDFIKKEEPDSEPEEKPLPIFHREDAYVLGDDVPDADLPELPQILPRKRRTVKRRVGGKKTKRKTRKTKSGTKRKKSTKGRRKKRTSAKKSDDGEVKIGRVRRSGREKEPKLHIRQNDDVIVMDEEPVRMPSPPEPPKPTPSNILDQILGGQEKIFGVVKPGSSTPKPRVLSNGRRTVW